MPLNLEKSKQELADVKSQTGGSGEGLEFLEFEEGPNQVRILPPFGNNEYAWVKGRCSYNVGPHNKMCVVKYDDSCPVKKEVERLMELGDEASKKRGDAMYPKNRVWYLCVTRAPHKQAGKLLIWNANVNNHRDILSIIAEPDYGDITDPQKGIDLNINFTPKEKTANGFPEWKMTPKRNSSPLGTPEEIAAWTGTDWFSTLHIGQPSEPEYILACLAGTEDAYNASSGGGAKQGDSRPAAPAIPPTPPGSTKKVKLPNPAAQYWVNAPDGSGVRQMTATELGDLMLVGNVNIPAMSFDQSSGWTTAEALGLQVVVETPPPPAAPAPPSPPSAGPPVAPPPPTPPSMPTPPQSPAQQSEEAALLAQLQKIREAKANGSTSQVAADLAAAMK